MSPEEKIEAAQKLIDEARAEIAAKKRNWPEKIEPGMLFRCPIGTFLIRYLGHARDLIRIADDAHEPTGAELVGKVCVYVHDDGRTYAGQVCEVYECFIP